ncbi:hypothetical protein Ssi03_68420 [Sphaerisporangium siamense]|uniref:Vegetative cell wall protein gp1 n=1 Tax=Sphaerisporangium siamense TaxID=795645 RepID=A0A7W7D5D9_9ACTN|nr:hypothetical protein [Sphaerisporangium siamense]MBB4700619.1 hypothetical protein [Sphaerisporangium siamense]GII88852.1 hypothetical protein Ssi03_68420 [Sphaerisporangium siamense]
MGGFLEELGKKLAERWLSLLVLPGVLYLAIATTAATLGHRHALDVPYLTARVTSWTTTPAATGAGGQVVLVAAVLAAAAGVGLATQGVGSAAERLILAADWRTWPGPLRRLARRRVTSRRTRWDMAHAEYHRLYHQAEQARRSGTSPDSELRARRHLSYRTYTRICLEPPDRPTWSGDRVNAAVIRLDRVLQVDLPTIWPTLWLHLPDTTRTEITTARSALSRATSLIGWSLLYLPLTGWWWPAVLISTVLAGVAWQRIRATAGAYALLLEAATHLHLAGLAENLGVDTTGKTPSAIGQTLTHLLHTPPLSATDLPARIPSASPPAT